jgi:hypothetical protein
MFEHISQMSSTLFQHGFSDDDEFFVGENPLALREHEGIVDGFMRNCLFVKYTSKRAAAIEAPV